MSCKAHKVCILLWPMGGDDMRTRADRVAILIWQVKRFGGFLRLCCGIILC